ncbi:unnamed protein product [Dovyalis caffra]|uniref:Beta-hexosaminidase n=1 Tax=Dovyalis caffra TaxID=77055 RepID=A0AAV1QZA7_9ROSI|nr:unnamed protein product [Dovyalis caffra]
MKSSLLFLFTICTFLLYSSAALDDSLTYVWPLPAKFSSGNNTLSVDPELSLVVGGKGGTSSIIKDGFDRYKKIIFKHSSKSYSVNKRLVFDIGILKIVVLSDNEELQLGVDESYLLLVKKRNGRSIIGEAYIEANTVYGALRGLESMKLRACDFIECMDCIYLLNIELTARKECQLCAFEYETKTVQIYRAPWYILDKPRFAYRGLLIDTSRHYLPTDVIKQIIESMSYAKLNVLHWHIIDEESFPLEVPSYPDLWKGSYTKWERYTVEDAYEIVNFAKMRGINVMAEIDVPGHAESWGTGYPDLWPSPSCREPLDVTKNFTFDVISGIMTDLRKIFPFGLFHLGGDEVNTVLWNPNRNKVAMLTLNSKVPRSTAQLIYMKDGNNEQSALLCSIVIVMLTFWNCPSARYSWMKKVPGIEAGGLLLDHNMTTKDAYRYFVLRAQEIAISKGWTPVNWEETFNTFASNLNPRTIVHNWLGGGVCPKAVAKGFRCLFSNQGFWYLDHLDVPWDEVYKAEPLEGINDTSLQELVLGGEVCMWGETADTSVVQQTIWPRAAAAAGVEFRLLLSQITMRDNLQGVQGHATSNNNIVLRLVIGVNLMRYVDGLDEKVQITYVCEMK